MDLETDANQRLRWETRQLKELSSDGWRPTRRRFEEDWPREELDSDWYERAYSRLYGHVREFVREYFGRVGDLPVSVSRDSGSVWVDEGLSTEFVWLAGEVAVQDYNAGGWDALLVRGVERACLVTGVIGKVLETSVFDDLLFGGDKTQKTMLEAQDECTLESEGTYKLSLA